MSVIDASPAFDLTEREIEILELLNEGLKNKEIAARTDLTLYTVKWYLKQIYSKLYVSNRTLAAAKARELGLFSDDVKSATRTMAAIRTNLPETVTSFFGRRDEVQQIRRLLVDGEVRLVTIHGIGGMGKTRLALEIGHQFLPVFQEGVYFIPLESTDSNPLLEVLRVLSLTPDTDSPVQQLGTYLHDRHTLLIFDNFEHLLPYAKELSALLEATHDLRIIVTTRELLNLRGEHVISLSGLAENDQDAAYQLYVQRATIGAVDFDPDTDESEIIHNICDLVGGMPLAIEMAAGWSSVMTTADTYHRLQQNIDLLTSDEHDRPERHQSIRATFDYSLEMLSDRLQTALLKLGVLHPDGFALQAAEAIAGLSPLDIKQLIQTALLQRDASGRFKLHPLIRQYINGILKSDSTLLAEAREAHGSYFYEVCEQLIDRLYDDDFKLSVVDDFRLEGGNLWYAWFYALRTGRYERVLVAAEMGYIIEMAGNWTLAQRLYHDTLHAIPDNEPLLRGRLLAMSSIFHARVYELEQLEASAHESWSLLKDSPYIYDGRAAMIYLAILKTVMKDNTGALDVLNTIDSVPVPPHIQPNAYVDSLNQIGRPVSLLYAGQLEDALPLLEKINLPHWSEAVIYLPECYFLLGMEDKAHQLLVHLYTAALDNRNHRLAQMTTFYLSLIEHDRPQLPQKLTANLIELTRMGFQFEYIARNAYYYGVTLLLRGLQQQAYYSWYGCLSFLDEMGEIALQYQYALAIAQHLNQIIPDESIRLLMAIAHDAKCPGSLRMEARNALAEFPTVAEIAPSTVYDILLTAETT